MRETVTKQQEYDKLCNQNWRDLLKIFHSIKGTNQEMIEQYVALKQLSKSKTLSPRQTENIVARCDYQVYLINNPAELPFANADRLLRKERQQSNGKP